MSTVQVRMEVSKATSAKVHYIAQNLGVPVKEVYPLIVSYFLLFRSMDAQVSDLAPYKLDEDRLLKNVDDLPF